MTPTDGLPVQVQTLELRIIMSMSWMREAVELMKHARRPQPNSGTAVWPVAVTSYLFARSRPSRHSMRGNSRSSECLRCETRTIEDLVRYSIDFCRGGKMSQLAKQSTEE